MTNAFYPSLDEFCNKYFVIGQKPPNAQEVAEMPTRALAECAALFEHLLLFDHTSLKLRGENVPLAFLYRQLGEKGLEALLEQEALKFVLWTPMVGHIVSDIPGVDALVSGNMNSPANSDPEASIEVGFNWITDKPPGYVLKRLRKKAMPLYEMPPPELAGETVSLVSSAFRSGKLKTLGFDPDKHDLRNLKLAERERLGKCAVRLLEYRFLMDREMTSMSSFEYFALFSDSLEHIESSGKIVSGFGELATLEGMPDLKGLFPTIQDGLKKVAKIREKRRSRRFRQWLSTATAGDKDIAEEYVAAIADRKGPLNSATGKSLKAVALASVGAALGHAVEGAVPGALLGGAAAQMAGPAVDVGIDLLDEFLLDGLQKGWHPRLFFDDLRKLEKLDKSSSK